MTEFDPDLYRGTPDHYDRFRIRYPQEMLDDLIGQTQPSGAGRLLDLACGTGQITFAIAKHFAEVWAVDQEPDMIEAVREKAGAAGVRHVNAAVSPAEALDAPIGAFELVAVGNAFHRLRREAIATNAFRWLRPDGWISLLWSTGPWVGERDWQRALSDLLARWKTKVGAQDRVPVGWDEARRERPDLAVLTAAGFEPVRSARFHKNHQWTTETLIGFVYSTSLLPRAVLGDHAHAFEIDVRRELDQFARRDALSDSIDFAYELARRPR